MNYPKCYNCKTQLGEDRVLVLTDEEERPACLACAERLQAVINHLVSAHGFRCVKCRNLLPPDFTTMLLDGQIAGACRPCVRFVENAVITPIPIGMIVPQPPSDKCQKCWKDKTKVVCLRCNKARYCNRDCRKTHWSQHKKICLPN